MTTNEIATEAKANGYQITDETSHGVTFTANGRGFTFTDGTIYRSFTEDGFTTLLPGCKKVSTVNAAMNFVASRI